MLHRIAIIAGLMLFTFVEALNFSGFCYSTGRYLSDDEMIWAAVKYNSGRPPFEGDREEYASLQELYERNPRCCSVDRSGEGRFMDGPWVRLFGWYVVLVNARYKFLTSGEKVIYNSDIGMNACGMVLDRFGNLEK